MQPPRIYSYCVGVTITTVLLAARPNLANGVVAEPTGRDSASAPVAADGQIARVDGEAPERDTKRDADALVEGEIVYRNERPDPPRDNFYYCPGSSDPPDYAFMADDLTLAAGACKLTHYDLLVKRASSGPDFQVTIGLYSGNPCKAAPLIDGTLRSAVVSGDGDPHLVSFDFNNLQLPSGTVWMKLRSPDELACWIVGEFAQIGSTEDSCAWSIDWAGCLQDYNDDDWHDGFVATVYCAINGACCLPDPNNTCIITSQSDCDAQNGTYQGDDTECGGSVEACCAPDHSCEMADTVCCTAVLSGTSMGPGTNCGASMEACCKPDDTCEDADTLCCTAELIGSPMGPGSACEPDEACCSDLGECRDLSPDCCANGGGIAQGPTTVCMAPQACCMPDGECRNIDPECCEGQGGIARPGTPCQGDNNNGGLDDACESIPSGSDCFETDCFDFAYKFEPVADKLDPTDPEFFEDDGLLLPEDGQLHAPKHRVFPECEPMHVEVSRTEDLMLLGQPGVSESTQVDLPSWVWAPGKIVLRKTADQRPILMDAIVAYRSMQPGTMEVTKTHHNGGIFTADFPAVRVISVFPWKSTLPLWYQAPAAPIRIAGTWVYAADQTTAVPCTDGLVPGVEESSDQCCRRVLISGAQLFHEVNAPECSPVCPDGACCDDPRDEKARCTLTDYDDCIGIHKGLGTDCHDRDGDLLADWVEAPGGGYKPIGHCRTDTNPLLDDSDGDGCLDGEEVRAWVDPLDDCDYLASCGRTTPNCDGDQGDEVRDDCQIRDDPSLDCDENGIIDACSPDVDTLTGACCNGTRACADLTRADCNERPAEWSWRGFCRECPTQGGNTSLHDGVMVRHWPRSMGDMEVCVIAAFERGAGCVPGPLLDAWQTDPDEVMVHEFDLDDALCPPECPAGCSPPIPANWFGAGSDPYDGVVQFQGVPLGSTPWGQFDAADTLVLRAADPFDRCDLPSGTPSTVDAEVVALSLVSVSPITVTYNGGQDPENWDVTVDLSTVSPAVGEVTATKTHCNGGAYTSVLNVQPRFTFTKVGDPLEVRELDTGLEGICPVTLRQEGPNTEAWSSDVDPGIELLSPYCTDFHAAIEDMDPIASCDCNENTTRDKCDIEQGTSQDCNENGIPDDCDLAGDPSLDCPGGTGNGVLDECEPDCQPNGIADSCDIEVGTSLDCNGNGKPDECDVVDDGDCNDNSVPDDCDIAGDPSLDCPGGTGNGVLDECEPDCQPNGVADSCDIGLGSPDADENGIPDECDFAPPATGACCLPGGDCLDDVSKVECSVVGGAYLGDSTACLGDNNGDGFDDACGKDPYHPADKPLDPPCSGCGDCSTSGNCQDGQIELAEMLGYACAWRRGCHDDGWRVGQSLPIWWHGECYCYDHDVHDWFLDPCPPPPDGQCEGKSRGRGIAGELAAGIAASGGATVQIVSNGPGRHDKTHRMDVSITLEPPEGTATMVLEYRVPRAWRVITISDGGAWDGIHRKVKWGPFFEDLPRMVTFEVRRVRKPVPVEADRLSSRGRLDGFSGTVWFDGLGQPIAAE